MTSYVAVVPFIDRDYFDACAATCKLNLFPVDNTEVNVGCTVAWNMGLKRAMDEGAEWCIWMSSACRFGPAGGLDFIEALAVPGHVVESQLRGHLIAIHRSVTERIGYCDENFWPSYWQDTDWAYRVRLGFGDELVWRHAEVDASSHTIGHSVTSGKVSVNFLELAAYYNRKWGGEAQGAWEQTIGNVFTTPFGEGKPLSWWPPPGHPLALPRPPRGQFIVREEGA